VNEDALAADKHTLYRAVSARDRRFDGRFVFAVTSTGIYCRPSCPARTPNPANVRYFVVPAAAVAAGFRACKRCRPDSVPGGRLWDHRGDLAARALRLVGAGAVDEGGVAGLAKQLAVSERHLSRTLMEEVGVGPLALASTRRAQTARMLLEQTDLPITDVAFTAGFASVRQFNDVMRAEFGLTPTDLRQSTSEPDRPAEAGRLALRLAAREPFDDGRLLAFLGSRAIPGLETVVKPAGTTGSGCYGRALRTSSGDVLVTVTGQPLAVQVELRLPKLAALRPVVTTLRRLFDLDAEASTIDAALREDATLSNLVRARPGLRVPGTASGFEIGVRAVVGQQISVAGARTILGRIVKRCGDQLSDATEVAVAHVFPSPADLAESDLSGLGLTTRRIATLRALARAVANEDINLEPGTDRASTRKELLSLPGIGAWTVEYVAMRALADPDAFPATDLVLQRRVRALGLDPERWRPWRAYAAIHLWTQQAEEQQ
jgi:AraC family transcriptional regulator of adaptative response / DNA-3-methyladenine glycosylase II